MADTNPILNNPYEEPRWHYATNLAGELDYSRPVKGRRIFTPEIQSIPVRQGSQGDLMELNEVAAVEYGSHPVNLLRREVASGFVHGQTSRETYPSRHSHVKIKSSAGMNGISSKNRPGRLAEHPAE